MGGDRLWEIVNFEFHCWHKYLGRLRMLCVYVMLIMTRNMRKSERFE